MAASPESTADTSLDLHEAVSMISDLPSPDASEDEPSGTEQGEVREAPEAAAAPQTEPVGEAAPGEVAEEDEAAAPAFWDDQDKTAWAKVPAELRPVLARYEQQRLDFVAEKTRQAGEERDEAMRVAQGANALVEQAADWWRKNGAAFHRAFVDRWSRVDWKGLAEKDPAEVGRLMQQRQEEETLLAEATRRGEADIAAAETQAAKAFEEAQRVEQGKLAAKLPEWFGTPQVAQRTWDDLRRYLFGKGLPADRISAVYEAQVVEIALNAMRFENARALADAVRQRSRQATEAVRAGQPAAAAATPSAVTLRVSPGPVEPRVDRASDAVRQAGERFRKSGGASIADAAELIRLSGL